MLNYFVLPSSAALSKSICRASLFAIFAFLIVGGVTASIKAVTDTVDASGAASSLPADSPSIRNQYNVLQSVVNACSLAKIVTEPTLREILSPAGNLCVNGALADADPDFNRPLASSTGTGIGNGTVNNCTLSGTATAANYDPYNFSLTGCAVYPTEITATLCGPAGCQHLGNVDTMLLLYRVVPVGDPLTANGGLPGVFNPASPCTNARAGSDDLGTSVGTPNNPGGATCNQVIGANCVAPCTSPSNAGGLSGFRRNIGSGNFTLVVAGFGNTIVGSYNLYVDAPAAGCTVTFLPTAASVSISGRVIAPQEFGLTNSLVTLTDSQGNARTLLTGKFGTFHFTDVAAGETYILTVRSKRYTYAPQVITATGDVTEVNFSPQ